MADEVENQLHKMRPGSGSTSVNSEMDATPSTFNVMNQRFEKEAKHRQDLFHPHPEMPNLDEVDDDEDEDDEDEED